ncbi:MAG: transcription elongation factor GreA [Chlorobi bacterium]|nr:transcription elongation factor GreA [Chlorobiota bacterium]
MGNISYYTKESYEKLKKQLEELEAQKPVIAQRIADARELGDLSENAEYHAAREALSLLEYKIAQLQEKLSNARIVDTSELDTDKVLLLSKVKVKNLDNGQIMHFTIVSPGEGDFKSGKLSTDSPLAKGLLRKKVGDVAEIQVPAGLLRLEILDISR